MLAHVEVWDDWPSASGATRLSTLPGVRDPKLTWRTGGEGGFTCQVPVGDPNAPDGTLLRAQAEAYATVAPGCAFRVMRRSGLWHDVRVLDVRDGSGEGMAAVTCGGLSTSLAKTPPVALTVAGGKTTFRFDGVGLSVTDHLTNYLKPQWDAIGLTFLEIGEVVPTHPIDVTYDGDSVWAALQKIEEITDTESAFRWDLSTGTCYLDIVPNDGTVRVEDGHELDGSGNAVLTSGFPTPLSTFGDVITDAEGPRLSVGFNAAITRTRSEVEQRTRVYGSGENGVTISEATWEIASLASDVIELADPAGGPGPILVDDQLNGLYLESEDGTTWAQITDADADAQTVTVSDDSAFSTGDRVKVRADNTGARLNYLEDPVEVAAHGLLAGVLSRPDIPESVNLVVNADQSVWTGAPSDPADAWAAVGTPTLTRTTTAAHRQIGAYSCRVQTTTEGHGYATPLVSITPTATSPYYSGFVSFKLVSGSVRVEMVATDGVDSWTFPDGVSQKRAITTAQGIFVQVGVAGAIDLHAIGATAVRMRIVQEGPVASECYVDAAQVTESAGQLPLVIGAGPTQLWQAVNTELAIAAPTRVRYEGRVIDFHAIDPVTYPDYPLIRGVLHTVEDARLGLVEGVRLLEVAEDLHNPGATGIVLSSLPGDLRSLRDRRARPRRNSAAGTGKITATHAGARVLNDFVTTNSDTTGTSVMADFTAADVGATLWVLEAGSGGGTLKTTVDSVTAENEIEMADAASASLTNAIAVLGTSEGVLTLVGSLGGDGGGDPTIDPILNLIALLEAQVRELAKRVANGGTDGTDGLDGVDGGGAGGMVQVPFSGLNGTVITAPAVGVVVGVRLTGGEGEVRIFDNAAHDEELFFADQDDELHVPIIVAPTERPFADIWYLDLLGTGSNEAVIGDDDFSGVGFGGGPDPLDTFVPSNPGSTGWTEWQGSGYEVMGFFLDGGGFGYGAYGVAPTVCATLDVAVPSGDPVIVAVGQVEAGDNGINPAFGPITDWRWILSATGDPDDSTLALVLTADGTSGFTASLEYTDALGNTTVLDSDSGTIAAAGGIQTLVFRVQVTRHAQDDISVVAQVGTSLDQSTMVIGGVQVTLSVNNATIENADHNQIGFYNTGSSDTSYEGILTRFAVQWGVQTPIEGEFDVTPLFWVTPP